MADDKAELRRHAEALGLGRLTDEQLEEFGRARAVAQAHAADMPRDFAPSDEPAHIFRASPDA